MTRRKHVVLVAATIAVPVAIGILAFYLYGSFVTPMRVSEQVQRDIVQGGAVLHTITTPNTGSAEFEINYYVVDMGVAMPTRAVNEKADQLSARGWRMQGGRNRWRVKTISPEKDAAVR